MGWALGKVTMYIVGPIGTTSYRLPTQCRITASAEDGFSRQSDESGLQPLESGLDASLALNLDRATRFESK